MKNNLCIKLSSFLFAAIFSVRGDCKSWHVYLCMTRNLFTADIVDTGLFHFKRLRKISETWSLTLREERKLRVFENMVLRRIFGSRRDEVTGEWKRLHNEELNDLYPSPNIVRVIKSRRMRWAEHVARMGEERGVYRVLVGNSEGKRPLWTPRRRWVDNIKMDLQEVGCGHMDWIRLDQDRNR